MSITTLARESMSEYTRDTPVGVVLAAGTGARLNNACKPLTRIAGVTLLERAVRTLREAGVKRVVVVVGHAGELVERFVCERGLDVELVENADFPRGNGASAGARQASASSSRWPTTSSMRPHSPKLSPAQRVGYTTRFVFDLPQDVEASDVAAFYKRRLEPAWRVVEELDGPVLNFRKGDSFVSINVDNWQIHMFEIAVDHDSGA